MTTSKPEVVAWYTPPARDTLPVVAPNGRSPWGEPLIRLADYQRLQANHERLQAECAHYKNAIAEITTRHSVDRWANTSSDKELEQYLSDGIAQLEVEHRKQLTRLQVECRILKALVEALEWLRGAINCTLENDKHQSGAWISTKHPRIKRIDELLATYHKQGDET